MPSAPSTAQDLNAIRTRCAEAMLGIYKRANAGHIASSLSCLEILVDLCFRRMEGADLVVLSKGHAAGALYVTLSLSGRMPEAELDTFYADGTLLAAHPPCSGRLAGIPFGTGSLGHGLGVACGLAFSQRFTGRSFHVYAILSDGDCNEGSTWEAALFAAHHRLSNLTVILDVNGLQGIAASRDVLVMESVVEKWRALGFAVAEAVNGNSFADLATAHDSLEGAQGARCVVARTTKGHGISFMENTIAWHYLPMNDEQYAKALSETYAFGGS